MSGENVELVGRLLDAFNRGDYASCLDLLDSAVEWRGPQALPEAGVLRGHDEVAAVWGAWLAAWEYYRYEVDEIIEVAPGQVVVTGREFARGRESGAELEARPSSALYEVSRGKVVRFRRYEERTAAVAAGRRNAGEAPPAGPS
jgi:ketosteroid isomerase-like protein